MSARLSQLQRQQTLLREHLAWIESEIARETPAGSLPAPTGHSPPTLAPTGMAASQESPNDADTILERYAQTERQDPAALRRGCFWVFIASLVLVISSVTAIWFFYYRD